MTNSSTPNNSQDLTAQHPKSKNKERLRLIFLFIFLILAVIVGFIWWHNYNKYISTDDANLDSYRIDISPLVGGRIVRLYVMEGDSVKEGDVLFDLKREGVVADATQAHLEKLNTDSSYYQVIAPASGIIGKRWCVAGDVVNMGQTVFTLNRGNEMWLAVYLEETKFSHIYLGQQAKFTLDAYDKLTFYGKIFYIGDNSASEFALVPPNNASGNYTKVTQRIPMKISIDSVAGNQQQRQRMKLISGMSATVKIEKQ